MCAAQDSLYTRRVLRQLCDRHCFGRGYVRNGLRNAEKFLVRELRVAGAMPFAGGSYTQEFLHPVNTFPRRCRLKLNGTRLDPGIDFIPDPGSCGLHGTFTLQRKDSLTYFAPGAPLVIELKNKLTFSVSRKQSDLCVIELDRTRVNEVPEKIRIRLDAVEIAEFASRNIMAMIPGTDSDSMVVFTAHYDHLGGIGRRTYFPGANDNASGVSMVLNLVRHYAAHPPRRTTVFIFFAAEEAGLIGSDHLVKSGLIDLKKIKFLINLDLLGTGDDGIMVVNGAIHEEHFRQLQAINDEQRLVKEIRKRGKAANSDHYHFSEAGVPAFFIYTLGGTTAYHDVRDVEKSLPLTDYKDVFKLILMFCEEL